MQGESEVTPSPIISIVPRNIVDASLPITEMLCEKSINQVAVQEKLGVGRRPEFAKDVADLDLVLGSGEKVWEVVAEVGMRGYTFEDRGHLCLPSGRLDAAEGRAQCGDYVPKFMRPYIEEDHVLQGPPIGRTLALELNLMNVKRARLRAT